MRVLAMASQKGGSGKTTLSGHLAVQAQLSGAGPVCLIDIDPQGSLADWWNEREADMPAFAQTTVARLASDLEVLRQQGFRLAVIDTPPAITMAIQSVIAVAELIVIPTRPSPHDLRAVGATVDLCDRAGKPLDLRRQCGNAQGQDHLRSGRRAFAARHRRSRHPSPPHRFRGLDDRWPDGHGDRSRAAAPPRKSTELVGLYFRPPRKEFPPDGVRRSGRRAGRRRGQSASRRRFRPPRRRPVRGLGSGQRSQAFRLSLFRSSRPQGCGAPGHAAAGLRPGRRRPRGPRLERHGVRAAQAGRSSTR